MADQPTDETIADRALNTTMVGGAAAILVGLLSAIVPVIEALRDSNTDVRIILGMEALAAVMAVVAAWIYTVDAKIRAGFATARAGERKHHHETVLTTGTPFTAALKTHPAQTEQILAMRFEPDTEKTWLLVAAHGGEAEWQTLEKVVIN